MYLTKEKAIRPTEDASNGKQWRSQGGPAHLQNILYVSICYI